MATPWRFFLATVIGVVDRSMAEITLLSGILALVGFLCWLVIDSDDDNGGGGLMQPVLVPVRVSSRPR